MILNAFQGGSQALEDNYTIDFDDSAYFNQLFIDTITNPSNIWQIGAPAKVLLSDPYTSPNVIITDTLNPYPPGDTSSFIFTNIETGGGFEFGHTVTMTGYYYVNSDSLNDYGLIEFSADMGVTWIDLLNTLDYEAEID